MKTYTFIIIGAGAIGKLFACILSFVAELIEWNINVYLLVRKNKRRDDMYGSKLDELRQKGITLKIGPIELRSKNVIMISDLKELQSHVHIIPVIATKAYDLEDALKTLGNFFDSKQIAAFIVPINGLGIESIIRKSFNTAIITCAVTLPVNVTAGNHYYAETTSYNGGFTFAHYENCLQKSQLFNDITYIFRQACSEINSKLKKKRVKFNPKKAQKRGLETYICDNSNDVRWSKLILNIIANITCAILQMTPKEVYGDAIALEIEWNILQEAFMVMDACGYKIIDLPGYPASDLRKLKFLVTNEGKWYKLPHSIRFWLFRTKFAKKIIKAREGKDPSFVTDTNAGLPTEAKWHNGAIAKAGIAKGLDVHYNDRLTMIIEGITEKEHGPNNYKGKPSLLMQVIMNLPS